MGKKIKLRMCTKFKKIVLFSEPGQLSQRTYFCFKKGAARAALTGDKYTYHVDGKFTG